MQGTSTKMLASLVGRELLSSFVQKIETISEKSLSYCTLVIISTRVSCWGLMLQKTHFLRYISFVFIVNFCAVLQFCLFNI